ncbi:MAG TPA: DNA-binding response regulator [Micromonosporaceae bacterium]|nr:DNA-binding response regulator [Micromonosporaceae bacterium]HCU50557.1 DNA-binding response regulator [Micromonosporaceae bacterium]
MTTRVMIVDDEALIRVGLRAIIDAEDDLEVVAEASDGAEVPPLVSRHRPDVVLMDVRMPAIDGIQATRTLTAAGPLPRVLVVTTFENDDYVLEALRAGASGFLLKRAKPEEVIDAIRTVARGDSLLFPQALRRLVSAQGSNANGGDLMRKAKLTEREAEVLRLMATGLSNAEIAAQLVLGLETVKTHVGNVLTKLGARDRTQAVIAAYESGFVSPSP